MDSALENDGVLSVTNNTITYPYIRIGHKTYDSKNKGKHLTPLVVEGGYDSYDFHNGPWEEPRDFIGATKVELERSGVHIDALRDGLKKRGIKTE